MAAKNVEIVVLLSGFGSLKADRTVFLGGRRQLRGTNRLLIRACFVVTLSPSHPSGIPTCCQTNHLASDWKTSLRCKPRSFTPLRCVQDDRLCIGTNQNSY
jgi:hypothetical protein